MSVVLLSPSLYSDFDKLNFRFSSHQPLLGVTKVFKKEINCFQIYEAEIFLAVDWGSWQ